MTLRTLLPLLGLLLLDAAGAQSRIPPRAVVNAASFARPGLPQGSIARGSIFSIFGQGIGPDSAEVVSEFPLQNQLAGVSIEITQGQTTVLAIPVFVAGGQINAILPSNAPLGMASLLVRNGVRRSNPTPIEIVRSQPGLFTALGTGRGVGIVQNFVSQAVQPINATSSPAQRGQVITIWATGLGPVDFGDNVAPTPGNLAVAVSVWIGGVPVRAEDLLYFGRSPCCAGVDQVIVRIPENAPLGCHVPLELRVDGGPPANTVTLSISAAADTPCAPDTPVSAAPRAGWLTMARAAVVDSIDRARVLEYGLEIGLARFRQSAGGVFGFDPTAAAPPHGACLAYNTAGAPFELLRATGARLDAGPEIRSRGPAGLARWSPV